MCMERDTYSKFGKNIQHSTERKIMTYVVRLDWGGEWLIDFPGFVL